jgi:putative phosphoesterase
MKIAVLSDIHGNIHALQVVLADMDRLSPEAIFCLGDLVGYGAHPNEVIDLIRQRDIPTIIGNYDDGVGFDKDDCGCVYKDPADIERGNQSLMWSREHTTPENKNYLRNLPFQMRDRLAGQSVLFVHGSPRKINEYLYEDRPLSTFERIAQAADCEVMFFGHTHLPYQKQVGRTLFVNTGSVGKPKDGDPRAGYVIAALGRHSHIEFRRVAYDVAAATKAIRESSLPPHFADLLETGGLAAEQSAAGVTS